MSMIVMVALTSLFILSNCRSTYVPLVVENVIHIRPNDPAVPLTEQAL